MSKTLELCCLLVCSDVVFTLGKNGLLIGEGLEHLGGTGESITALTNADVHAELGDADLAHGVLLDLLLGDLSRL